MIKDSNHPFFRPAVAPHCGRGVLRCLGDFRICDRERPSGACMALGFAGYGVWQFFIVYDASEPVPPADAVNA